MRDLKTGDYVVGVPEEWRWARDYPTHSNPATVVEVVSSGDVIIKYSCSTYKEAHRWYVNIKEIELAVSNVDIEDYTWE